MPTKFWHGIRVEYTKTQPYSERIEGRWANYHGYIEIEETEIEDLGEFLACHEEELLDMHKHNFHDEGLQRIVAIHKDDIEEACAFD